MNHNLLAHLKQNNDNARMTTEVSLRQNVAGLNMVMGFQHHPTPF